MEEAISEQCITLFTLDWPESVAKVEQDGIKQGKEKKEKECDD